MARKKSSDDIVLQRVSKRNVERILEIEHMQIGDSFDNVLSRVLDRCENCIKKQLTIDELQAVYDLVVVEDHASDSDEYIDLLGSASDKLFSIIEERKKKEP